MGRHLQFVMRAVRQANPDATPADVFVEALKVRHVRSCVCVCVCVCECVSALFGFSCGAGGLLHAVSLTVCHPLPPCSFRHAPQYTEKRLYVALILEAARSDRIMLASGGGGGRESGASPSSSPTSLKDVKASFPRPWLSAFSGVRRYLMQFAPCASISPDEGGGAGGGAAVCCESDARSHNDLHRTAEMREVAFLSGSVGLPVTWNGSFEADHRCARACVCVRVFVLSACMRLCRYFNASLLTPRNCCRLLPFSTGTHH